MTRVMMIVSGDAAGARSWCGQAVFGGGALGARRRRAGLHRVSLRGRRSVRWSGTAVSCRPASTPTRSVENSAAAVSRSCHHACR